MTAPPLRHPRALRRWRTTAAVIAILAASAAAPAAEIQLDGRTYSDVRVLGLRDGALRFQTLGGLERSAPLDRIRHIEIEGRPRLTQAQQALREGRLDRAVELLSELDGEAGEAWLKALIGGKLIVTLDMLGRADEAIARYLDLLRIEHSEYARTIMPANLPPEPPRRQALADAVRQRIDLTADPLARRHMQALLQRLLADPAAAAEAPTDPAAPAPDGESTDDPADPIAQLLEAGRHEQALQLIERELQRGDAPLSRLLHQRGLALAALGRDRDAALSFMRIVIHFRPSSTTWYLPSLVEAGKAFRKLEQPHHARQLWTEALALADSDSELARELTRMLDALPKDSAAPDDPAR